MADRIQIRRDTAANWASVNPVLAQGEMGLETDTEQMKLGDGTTAYNALNYFVTSQTNVGITGGTIDDTVIGGTTAAAGSFTTLELGGTGITATATELNVLDGITATTAELNILDGITATTAELNYTDGVTSNIQTQLNTKAPIASPTFTGTATIPTADINGGTIDGTVIGGSTAAAGSFTTGQFDTSVNVDGTVTADGAEIIGDVAINTTTPATYLHIVPTDGELNDPFTGFRVSRSASLKTAQHSTYSHSGGSARITSTVTTGAAGGGFNVRSSADGTTSKNLLLAESSGDISFYEDTGTTAKLKWSASGETLTFADNAKAIFGAGSDLQIYHDGSNSYVGENGTGSLVLHGTQVALKNGAQDKDYITCTNNGGVRLFYDNAEKLLTAATGIDVTGTVTADGLSVDASEANILGRSSTIGSDTTLIIGSGTNTADSTHGVQFRDRYGTADFPDGQIGAFIQAERASAAADYNLVLGTTTSSTTDAVQRLRISHNGDISFYEDTGTTAKLFWDASAERLGIGNAAPATALDVTGTVTADGLTVDGNGTLQSNSGSSVPTLTLKDTDANISVGQTLGRLSFASADASPDAAGERAYITASLQAGGTSYGVEIGAMVSGGSPAKRLNVSGNGDISFYEDTGTTAKLYWDASAESLGIGTSSPTRTLSINGSLGVGNGTIEVITAFSDRGIFGTQSNHALELRTNGTERMRIDSSGNLFVGKTATGVTTEGFEVRPQGLLAVNRDDATALYIGRLTSDGSLVEFRKNGAVVGSIGTRAAYVKIGNGDTNLLFNSAANAITPEDAAANSDGILDLGRTTSRFKDLYLSGGVYIGGTAAANHLDDYEEGTWTPVLSDGTNNATASTAVGTYTKIGRMVHVKGALFISSLGSVAGGLLLITGLPFNTSGTSNTSASANFGYGEGLNLPAGTSLAGYLNTGNTRIVVQSWDAVAGTTNTTAAEWSADGSAYFDATYYI